MRSVTAAASGATVAALVARGLHGTSAAAPSEDVGALIDALVTLGAGPLAWWALRGSGAEADPSLQPLRDTYQFQVLRARVASIELASVRRALDVDATGVLLGKGCAVADRYPAAGLRPYGDFDLYAHPDRHDAVRASLGQMSGARLFDVDLHRGASYLDDRDFNALQERSRELCVGATSVRTFAHEDLLRLACLHLLAEGAMRPVWLCDVAVLLPRDGEPFDWRYFGSGDPRRTEWAYAAIGLAHTLLGADVSLVPAHRLVAWTPAWMVRTVLEMWGRGARSKGARTPIGQAVGRGPSAALAALRERWPNPIEATIGVGGRFSGAPRIPYQVADVVRRSVSRLQ
jgi:hypothetical protein